MNFIEIMGHLGADAEVRYSPNGQKIVNLRVATNSRKAGKDFTTWWRVVIWGEKFDKILPYFKKGSSIIVMGEMQKPEVYVDKNGASQVSLEINADVIRFSPFGKANAQGEQQPAMSGYNQPNSPSATTANPFTMNPIDDLGYGANDAQYPSMEYDEQQPVKGQATSATNNFTHDNIPF